MVVKTEKVDWQLVRVSEQSSFSGIELTVEEKVWNMMLELHVENFQFKAI